MFDYAMYYTYLLVVAQRARLSPVPRNLLVTVDEPFSYPQLHCTSHAHLVPSPSEELHLAPLTPALARQAGHPHRSRQRLARRRAYVPHPSLAVRRVLSVLRASDVLIVGRHGPLQAAFTTNREMMNLPDAAMVPLDPILLAIPEKENGNGLTRQQARTLQLLQKGSKNAFGTTRKTWSLDFFRSPTGFTAPAPASPSGPSSRSL
ncbi:hypothetical protein LXA43DRAFT_239684 [Ganoderma leucocontextum]|nr:hypothetical protein LXA43DRAFT_239684 [Ganoderma leucocontextum]